LRDADQILEVGEEVRVIQKDAVDGTFEDHHLHVVVVLELRDDLSALQNELRTHEVERRVVQYDPKCEGVTRSSVTCAARVAEGMTLLLLA
jgi:hypothetical protein